MLQAVRQIYVHAIVACLDLIHSSKIVSISIARDRNCQTELSSGARARHWPMVTCIASGRCLLACQKVISLVSVHI